MWVFYQTCVKIATYIEDKKISYWNPNFTEITLYRSSVNAGSSFSSSPTAEQSETKILQDCPEPNATSSPLVKAPVLKRSPSAPVILKKPVRMLNGDPVWVKGK